VSEFVFLYRCPPTPPRSPQQMQDVMQRWLAWFKEMEKGGHLAIYGHPLEHTGGGVLKSKTGSITDGPYAETKDIVIGFSVIEARDFEEAVKLASVHPIFDQGGIIEVRPVMKM